jgi:multimeric flavodoxin WrbA
MAGSDLIVFATPLHFVHASGQLKTFLDRLSSMGGNPHDPPKTPAQEPRPAGSAGRAAGPRLALVASCGHPRPAQFRSLSLWMEDLASLLGMGLFMEALVASASRLVSTAPEDLAAVEGYRGLLRAAGGAAARGEDLAPSLRQALKGGL